MHLASFGPFRRLVTTSAGCTTPTRPSLPSRWTVPPASICPTPGLHLASTTTNESSRLVGRFPRPPSAFPPPPTSHDDSLDGFPGLLPPSHHHQRVTTTRWAVSRPPSAIPPPPTSHDDLLVVPTSLGFHLP